MKAQTKKLLLGLAVLALVIAVMAGCWLAFGPKAGPAGQKEIGVSVVYADAAQDEFELTTSAEFLRGALEEAGLVAGEESEFGLFITTVNGVAANADNEEWWALSKGGEMLMTGADSTPIADGDHFELTLTIGYD